MVDEQQPDPNQSLEVEEPSLDSVQDNDWGEDWDSAFQAEEYLFTDDAEVPDIGASFTDDAESDDSQVGPSDKTSPAPIRALTAKYREALSKLAVLGKPANRLMARVTKLPPKAWLAITSTLILLLLISVIRPLLAPAPTPVPQSIPAAPSIVTEQGQEQAAEPTAPITKLQTPLPPVVKKTKEIPPQVDRRSKKWTFSSFLIPVTDEKSKEITLVSIDLSLVTALAETQEIPMAQKPLVRNIIFQFFSNRPLYELRRYSLARGEMNRKLLDWIRKQWPEGSVEGIIFHRYQVG